MLIFKVRIVLPNIGMDEPSPQAKSSPLGLFLRPSLQIRIVSTFFKVGKRVRKFNSDPMSAANPEIVPIWPFIEKNR